jgi:hypothetical protein
MKVTELLKATTASLDVCLKRTDGSYLWKSESQRTHEAFVLTHDGSQEQDVGPSKLIQE